MSVLIAALQVIGAVVSLVVAAALLVLLQEFLERRYGKTQAGIWTALLALSAGPLAAWALAEPDPHTFIRGSNNTIVLIGIDEATTAPVTTPCQ